MTITVPQNLYESLTAGFNTERSPMANGPMTPLTPGGVPPQGPPTAPPPQQAQQGGGIGQKLMGLLRNPQFVEAITQLAVSRGRMGGPRGQGFQNQSRYSDERALEQQRLQQQQRQHEDNLGIQRSEIDQNNQARKASKLSDLAKMSASSGIPISQLAGMFGVEIDPAQAAQFDKAVEDRTKSKMVTVDMDPESPSYLQVIANPDPENSNHVQLAPDVAKKIINYKAATKNAPAFYMDAKGNVKDSGTIEALAKAAGKTPEQIGWAKATVDDVLKVRGQDKESAAEKNAQIKAQKDEEKAKRDEEKEAKKEFQAYVKEKNAVMDAVRKETGEAIAAPPGTEVEKLLKQGEQVRRWGAGQKMPPWLVKEYFKRSGNNKEEATRMALNDGWDIGK